MTAVDARPANGHTAPTSGIPTQPLSEHTNPDSPDEGEHARKLRTRVAERGAERDLLRELAALEADPVFTEAPSDEERAADRRVAENIRERERADRERAGKANVRRARWTRLQTRLDERAERTRDRILDPARTLGADYRRWIATSAILFALLAGGALFMSHTVKVGLVGVEGTVLAYLVEPLASLVLVLSMIAQYTARQRGVPVPRGFLALDATLGLASVALMTIPWGMRFGWNYGEQLSHLLLPALMVIGITAWHMASGIYSETIANSKRDTALQDRLALLRQAVRSGDLPVNPSANAARDYLRATLPGGISQREGRRVARNFLGY